MKTGLKAWVKQRSKDVAEKGSKQAPWIVFWNDPNGRRKEKSCGPGRDGWRLAQKEKQRIHGQLIDGSYEDNAGKPWKEFWQSYQDKILPKLAVRSRDEVETSIAHFERIAKPGKVNTITTETIDKFICERRCERGKRPGSTVSPATVNKDLRHVKMVLSRAVKWRYLSRMPEFDFEREPKKEPTYITPEDFAVIYAACDSAKRPKDAPYAADWWRALLVTLFMTGWRIGETMALRWDEVDLATGCAKLRHETTKGRRYAKIELHPLVIDHLAKIQGFGLVFPWRHHRRTLDVEFHRIQKAAGILRPIEGHTCEDDGCTDAGHFYGFHDERRAFATLNAANLTVEALQGLMRHRSYQTTQRYIEMAKQLEGVVSKLYVPATAKNV